MLRAPRPDWGEAADVAALQGRTAEVETLERWLGEERCRVVALLGQGGVGKTALATRLARDLAPEFDYVYWRSACLRMRRADRRYGRMDITGLSGVTEAQRTALLIGLAVLGIAVVPPLVVQVQQLAHYIGHLAQQPGGLTA